MIRNVKERIDIVAAVLGKKPYNTIIRNTNVVNVYSGEVLSGNIGIKHGRIASTQVPDTANTNEYFDANGKYAIPGFIDTHVHIDSTLLTPEGIAELMVPHGTTAVFADPMEIANVAGYKGLEALFKNVKALPFHIHLEVPSRVPTAPGLETTGGELKLDEVKKLLDWETTISLGELDPSKVLGLKEEYYAKVEAAHALGKIANGHAAGLCGTDLIAYACGGLADDHECVSYEDAKARLELGLAILVREGSSERNLEALIEGLLNAGMDTRHWMMCTDDKHPNEILQEGHINYMVNKAISLGMDPIHAIQMATINAADHFRIEDELGSISPGRWADIILAEDLTRIEPAQVFYKGKLVAEEGKLVAPIRKTRYPEWIRKTVMLTSGKASQDFRLGFNGKKASVHVIGIYADQIINQATQATLTVKNGEIQTDVNQDTIKLAVVERYGKNGNIGITFVKGFGLTKGAISSTVAHDHHNLIIAGVDDVSMATCTKASEKMQGGLVVAQGNEVLAQLPLPIGGLMSDRAPLEVIENLEQLNLAARSLGCLLPAPFMTLSFISLPTVPELGLTDMGLVDVREHTLISPFV